MKQFIKIKFEMNNIKTRFMLDHMDENRDNVISFTTDNSCIPSWS